MPRLVVKKSADEQANARTPDFLPDARRIAMLAADHKAENIRGCDVRELTVIADAFVFCTVTSDPHMGAVFNAVKEGMKEVGVAPLRTEGTMHNGWTVLDFGSVIVHIFKREAREFYDLDGLWADAPALALDLAENKV